MTRAAFRERIRAALASDTLQLALDANAERRVHGRVAAFASLPDAAGRRRQAHHARADVIEYLDDYLDAFSRRAQENGFFIHRAADAAEANRIVLEIVRGAGPPQAREYLIAKSKSMVTEEIRLNAALKAAGMRAVETDLGEYIVQLRGETPSHIITPAVHLRRADVGRLFHEQLGIPYTEDIPTLIRTARDLLRDVFLSADVGISGVNFGIADTGGICIVSNEGNARMVTTVPRVHIALMGMERLVRSLDDLALMLSLLPRSATTQKLSAYTQLIHAPLPGQQRHLVILDNGRTRLRNSPLRESLYCIRCGACLNACPVFREIGGHGYQSVYPGPIGSVISAGFFGPDLVPLAQASSLCGACREACPVDIDLPKLLTRVRAGQSPPRSDPPFPAGDGGLSASSRLILTAYSRVARSPRLFALSQKLAALGTRLAAPFGDQIRMPAVTGWGYSRDLPRFAGQTFRERFRPEAKGMRARLRADRGPGPGANTGGDPAAQVPPDRETLIAQFIEELTRVNAGVVRTVRGDLSRHVIAFLTSRQIDRIHLEPNILDEAALATAGVEFSRAADPSLRAGVTGALCGLADTGSIVIADAQGDPLRASLLPEIHLAVLGAGRILPSLPGALALPIVRISAAAVVITGPSRTADIEMSLTIGMHGPGELHIFLVDD